MPNVERPDRGRWRRRLRPVGTAGRVAGRFLVVVLAVLAVAALPSPARAADGIVDTAATTYELEPGKGLLTVTIDVRVTNELPIGSREVPCTEWAYDPWTGYYPITTTCRQSVDYYVNSTYVWLERSARNVTVSADRGSVSRAVEKRLDEFIGYKLTFEPLYGGQARKIRITYEVPGGAPRSASATRIGRAYVNFCAFANGLDSGSVRVVVPAAYATDVRPAAMTATRSGGSLVYRSGTITDTTGYYRCFEGTNDAGFARSEVRSPSGRTILVEGWPEDGAWREAVGAEVVAATTGLEALLGRGLPGSGPITIREVSDSELGDYAGIFDPAAGIARISETYTEPGVIAHELAHAWFNLQAFEARWLSEGLAQWAERVSPTAGEACVEPGPYPGRGSPDLDEWAPPGPRATEAERAVLAYNYAASCWIVTALGDRVGEARMGEVIGALLDRRAAYGDEATDRRPGGGPVDWRAFLDVVDEVGLMPAGVADPELAQDLLLAYGVADPTTLRGRAEARAAFHALAADLDGWEMPDAIRTPLERWSFAEAQARVATAAETLALVEDADRALAGIDAAGGPAKASFETATDADDLAKARMIAADQAAAAADAADALAVMAEPLDTLEEIGMWGEDLAPVADEAVAAATAADAGAAAAAADEIRGTLTRASGVGTQRVAFGAGGAIAALLLLAGAVLLVRRRRRPRPVPVPATSAPPAPWATWPEAVSTPGEPDDVTVALDTIRPEPGEPDLPRDEPG